MKRCKHCGRYYTPSRKSQKYCTDKVCSRARKRQWQKAKLATDPDYRAAQREAQARWRHSNPDYSRRYRAAHPSYTNRNRHLQHNRNKRRIASIFIKEKIAKMDAKPLGLYRLSPVSEQGELIAKMESKYVQLYLIQGVT